MYFRVFIKFRVCTCIHDTRYTIHDIDEFRVYTVTSLMVTYNTISSLRVCARFQIKNPKKLIFEMTCLN